MMLTSLYEYAQRQGLLEDTDYETRRIDLVVELDAKGRLLSVISTDGKMMPVPRFAHSVAIEAAFAADNAKYALGVAGADAEAKDLARVDKCHAAFSRLMIDTARQYPTDVPLQALAAFLKGTEAQRPGLFAQRPKAEWTGGENVVFRVGGVLVHESPGAKQAWALSRQGEAVDTEPVRCLVTGLIAPAALTHPWVKRVPGTQQAQTAIVSFNNSAFTSMGFAQAQNAPVSRKGAEGYVTGLNDLLSQGTSKGRRYSSGIGLGDETVMVVWTREATPELGDLLDYLDAREADSGIEAVGAPWTARFQPSDNDSTDFFAATLGANAARAVVRDWYQSRFGVVKAAVRKWFADLALVGAERPPAIWQLLGAIDPPGNAAVPPSLATALGHCALFGGRMPLEVMRHALMRLRVPPKPKEKYLLQQRVALIKLTLIRTLNQEISVALDEEKKAVPYLLGRLFAVLERLQGAALGDLNATIRDRYFGAASSTPAVVFPRLLRLSVHHASKSGAGWLEGAKGRIISQLPSEQFPQILSLEDQGLFAVGYYQQREKFFEKRDATTTTTTTKKEENE